MNLNRPVPGPAWAGLLTVLLVACSSSGDNGDTTVGDPGPMGETGPETEVSGDVPDTSTFECDVLFQDCVIGDGCYLTSDGSACQAAGSAKEGEACAFLNTCEPGMACVNLDAGSVCALLCDADDDQDPKACKTLCTDTFGTLAGVDGVGFCKASDPVIPCDILLQDCPAGQGCYLALTGVACAQTTDGLELEDDCEFANQCKPGLICLNGACTQVCDPAAPDCPLHLSTCSAVPELGGAGICAE